MDELSDEEKTLVARARRIQFFLSQKLQRCGTIHWSAWFLCSSCLKLFVALRKSLMVKHDHLPEDAFRGVGSIEDVNCKSLKKWDF